MNWFELLIGSLITWRAADILVKQKGPLMIFTRLRAFLASRQKHMGGLYDMIACITCASMYVAAVTALGFAGGFFEWVAYTLAFSAITSLIESQIR